MKNAPSNRPNSISIIETAAVTSTAPLAERESRGSRRKRETRARLLEAALGLMAERGMEGVAINEITEAADVGFGSFYNHFESKEAIYTALMGWVFDAFADRLDQQVRLLADPAETIAVCIRHTLLRARQEPVWGRFLLREGFSKLSLSKGLGQRLLRDIQQGVEKKRFLPDDISMCFVSAGGTVMAAIAAELLWDGALERENEGGPLSGGFRENLPERTAATVLQALGLGRTEAVAIAFRPLPGVAWDDGAD
jgi:AcrR family transcriptional regulator